jgi:hypothetical protein
VQFSMLHSRDIHKKPRLHSPAAHHYTTLLKCASSNFQTPDKHPKHNGAHQQNTTAVAPHPSPVAGSTVFTQLSITASGLSGVPLGLNWSVSGSMSGS